MYEEPAVSGRRSARPAGGRRRAHRRNQGDGREQVRLLQLLICLALFLVVFIGKGVFPTRLLQARDGLLRVLGTNIDFRGAFAGLGEAVGGGSSLADGFQDFCIEVFGAGTAEEKGSGTPVPEPRLTSLLDEEGRFFSEDPDTQTLANHYFQVSGTGTEFRIPIEEQPSQEPVQQQPEQETKPPEEDEPAIAAAGTVLNISDYKGDPLPNNYTMNELSLGDLERITPVIGRINSEYGYRDHPITGEYGFHGGVDISGKTGDPIQAFADGKVEYVGKGKSYGLYLQIDHGNGVKSFYAHCSKIVVKKGQTVSMGEKIAEIGSTGSATGPHLHLELKYEKMHLNPIYYIQYLSDQ